MSKTTKRFRALLITLGLVIATNIAISYAGNRSGVANIPDPPHPRSGVANIPDPPHP